MSGELAAQFWCVISRWRSCQIKRGVSSTWSRILMSLVLQSVYVYKVVKLIGSEGFAFCLICSWIKVCLLMLVCWCISCLSDPWSWENQLKLPEYMTIKTKNIQFWKLLTFWRSSSTQAVALCECVFCTVNSGAQCIPLSVSVHSHECVPTAKSKKSEQKGNRREGIDKISTYLSVLSTSL